MMKTQFVETAQGKIAYEDTGSGPLVVCLPGMGDLRGTYRYQTPQLVAAGYRVVTVDLRGHGESSVGWNDYTAGGVCQDILTVIRHLNAGPAVVIGNSYAAGAAVWAAAAAPELVRGLVLLGPAVHGKVSPFMRLMIGVLFLRPWGPAIWQWYFNGLFKTRKPADMAEYSNKVKQNLSERGRLEALHQMAISPTPDSETRMEQVNVPVLIMMGSKDPDFKDPAGEAEWITGQLHGTRIMIEGAGHYPQAEMPELSGPYILDFLNKLNAEKNLGTTNRP